MRYALKAAVDGQITIVDSIVVDLDDLKVELLSEEGTLAHVRVSTQVSANDFATSIDFGTGDKPASIEIKGDVEVIARLVRFLQQLESFLSFTSAGALRRIRWDIPEHERTIESPDERAGPIVSIQSDYRDRRPIVALDREAAVVIATSAEQHPELAIPMAFWREALNDYHDRRFVQAFYNFYFVVEGFYGNGKTSEPEVLKAFGRSDELRTIAERLLNEARGNKRVWPPIQRLFEDHRCSEDTSGLLRLIVRLRGMLHHYSSRSTRTQPVPFEQEQFDHAAWLALGFAEEAIAKRCPKMPLVRTPQR